MEYDERRRDDQGKAQYVVPLERFTQIENRKAHENRQRNDLLDGFKLRGTEVAVAYAIGRHLKTVFKKSNEPADNDNVPESDFGKTQMSVPSKSHKQVGAQQKSDGDNRNWQMRQHGEILQKVRLIGGWRL